MRWSLAVIAVGCGGPENPAADADDTGDAIPAPVWPEAWVALEDEVLRLVNGARFTGGTCGAEPRPGSLPALESDPVLRRVARAHSEDMSARGFFDHVNPDGDDPFVRMADAGFGGALPWGENIAAGPPTADSVFGLWMDSPPHCANILTADFRVIGIGFFSDQTGPFWTQDFAASH